MGKIDVLISKLPEENPDPVIRIGDLGEVLFINKAGYCIMRLWHCDIGDTIPEPWNSRFIATLTSNVNTEFRLKCRDRIYSLLVVPIVDHRYINIYGKDVTPLIQLQDELRKTSERFRGIFNNAAIGIIEINPENRFIHVNDRICRILGYTSTELTGKTIQEITYPDDLQQTEQMNAQLRGSVNMSDYEKRYLKKDGSSVWVHVTVSAIRNNKGEHIRSIATVEDISTRKEAEFRLQQSEELFRNMFERHGSIMLLIEQLSGNILDANSAASNFYGYTRDQLQSMNISQINQLPANDIEKSRDSVARGDRDYFQFPHRIANGEIKWVEVHSSPIMIQGKIFLFSIINDITEKKNFEKKIEIANRELKIAHDFMESILHISMHDLRTPVGNLSMFFQLMEEEEDESEKRTYLEYIKEIIDNLSTTLSGLTEILEFLSIKKVMAQPVKLIEIINASIKECDQMLIAGNIYYDLHGINEIVYIKPFMESILKNLVNNAVKYRSNKRRLQVKISCRRENDYVVLCVEDNGIGIDTEKYRKVLFRPFRRFTDTVPGTGVGLYMIKNIIERNGGHIELKSELDKGTEVCCYIKEYVI